MTNRRFAAACFDLDGTLIDTGPPHLEAERATVQAFGIDDLAPDHPVTFGKGVVPGAQLVTDHYDLGSVDDVLAEYIRQWERIVAGGIDMLPGSRAAVHAIVDAGLSAALVTSGERSYADGFLRISGLAETFRCSVTLEDVDNLKPNPEPYLRAAEMLQVAPGECVVFEDSVAGFKAAKSAGMYCVGVGEIALAAAGDDAPDFAVGSFLDLNTDQLLA